MLERRHQIGNDRWTAQELQRELVFEDMRRVREGRRETRRRDGNYQLLLLRETNHQNKW